MKINFLVLMAAVFILSGCGDSSKPGTVANTVSNTVNAPTEYLGTIVKARLSAEKSIDTISINQAITYFSEAEGRYPTNLDELVTKHHLHAIPKPPYGMKFVYDAATGTVKVVKE